MTSTCSGPAWGIARWQSDGARITVTDQTTLIATPGWRSLASYGANAEGAIVGRAQDPGLPHRGFLLEPLPAELAAN